MAYETLISTIVTYRVSCEECVISCLDHQSLKFKILHALLFIYVFVNDCLFKTHRECIVVYKWLRVTPNLTIHSRCWWPRKTPYSTIHEINVWKNTYRRAWKTPLNHSQSIGGCLSYLTNSCMIWCEWYMLHDLVSLVFLMHVIWLFWRWLLLIEHVHPH